MISLETYNKNQLEELINSDRFNDFPFYPITAHRAISHINNPNLEDNTTSLILAFEDGNLAGYIGILADYILHKGQKIQVGWLSTFFVHPDFRGKKIAPKLLKKAYDEYEGKILITEFTPEAEAMYIKSNLFIYQNPLKGMSFHFLSNLENILPLKNKKWKKYVPLIKLFDKSLNLCMRISRKFHHFIKEDFETTKNIDNEIENFIKENKKANSFNRNFEEIEWIIKYPWILNHTNLDKKEYQFSAFEKKFEYVFIKIYKDKRIQCILLLSVRNSNAKLHLIIGDRNALVCSQILYQFALKNNITNLISFEEDLNKCLSKKNIIFQKVRQRKFLMHKNLQKILGPDYIFDVSAGESEAIFT